VLSRQQKRDRCSRLRGTISFPENVEFQNQGMSRKRTILQLELFVYVLRIYENKTAVKDPITTYTTMNYAIKHIFELPNTYDP